MSGGGITLSFSSARPAPRLSPSNRSAIIHQYRITPSLPAASAVPQLKRKTAPCPSVGRASNVHLTPEMLLPCISTNRVDFLPIVELFRAIKNIKLLLCALHIQIIALVVLIWSHPLLLGFGI